MNSCKFNVAFCLDSNYQAHFGAAVMSLLLNYRGKPTDLCVHVVIDNPDDRFIKNVEILNNTFAATIKIYPIYEINIPQFNALPLNRFYTRATYLYYLLPYVIPDDVKTILSLDSDLVVLTDISKIFEQDLSQYALAGVSDASVIEKRKEYNLDAYVNSGVLLINLDNWRQNEVSLKCMSTANNLGASVEFLDQCAVNLALKGKIKTLHEAWNVMTTLKGISCKPSTIKIIHYISEFKPWHDNYTNPLGEFYSWYAKISPWGAVI